MLAWLPSSPTAVSVHSPLTVPADHRQTEIGEERDRSLKVANGDADVFKLMGM